MSVFLVTGVSGFIGSNLSFFLLKEGHRVIGLDNFSTGFRDNLSESLSHPNFTLIDGDIRDLDTCKKACEGVDFVLHQAALGSVPRSLSEPILYHENNTGGTLNMMVAARDAGTVKRFVYASSSSVYGDTPVLPKVETMTPNPKSPYAISKLSTEHYGSVFFNAYGLQTIGLRYFNVFGPRQNPNSQYAAVIPKFITAGLRGIAPTIHGDGEQTRDFTYIDNVIQANLKSCYADASACGKAYNVGCGDRISLNLLAQEIAKLTGNTCAAVYTPPRVGDVKDSLADIHLAQQHLGVSEFISLQEGLARTVAWYRSCETA
jgi:UDP-N-acetylglucosamine 4-epimerase